MSEFGTRFGPAVVAGILLAVIGSDPISAQPLRVDSEPLKGVRILCFSTAGGSKTIFDRNSPVWTQLGRDGAKLAFARHEFPRRKLRSFDQLWIFSGNPQEAARLTQADLAAILQFVGQGRGLYLLADNVPNTFEANVITERLFGAKVKGNYPGMQMLTFPGKSESESQQGTNIKRHPLLKGISRLYEGNTISHLAEADRLQVVISASDGKPLVAVPKVPSIRVVIDCGYTRYVCLKVYGKTYSDRADFARNVARFLAEPAPTSHRGK